MRLALLLCLIAAPAHAHHSKDWLIAEGPVGAEHKKTIVFSNQNYFGASGGDSGEWVPGVVFGLTHNASLEFHADNEWEQGEGAHLSSLGLQPAVWKTLDPVWTVGLTGEYEFSVREDESDGANLFAIARWKGEPYEAVANIGFEKEVNIGEDPVWIGRVGFKSKLNDTHSLGLEWSAEHGDLDVGEVALCWYAGLPSGLGIKAGAGFGLTEDSPDYTVRTALVYGWGGHIHAD